MQVPVRFSSCRGVAFEAKPHADHFAIESGSSDKRLQLWPIWRGSSKVSASSVSRSSSHFCDLDHFQEEDEEEEKEEEDIYKDDKVVEDLEKQLDLPKAAPKPRSRLSIILLDQGLFTVYNRLFAVSFLLNATALALAATGSFPYARKRATLFAIANVLALTLCRSEAFLRAVFWLAVNVLGWPCVPLSLKTATTSLLQSLGGVHSGCGVSSVAWLVYALTLTLANRDESSPEIVAVASAILGLLGLSSLAAFPLLRHRHHNVFERTHRFAGWAALALLWAFVALTTSYDPKTRSYSVSSSGLVRSQEVWLTVAITVLIAAPWVTVRRVPVEMSAPSGHASIIKFAGGVEAGVLGRISRSPLSEWHAFGIISDGKDEHMMLAGAVGDFTKGLVSDPPSHLWVRRLHFAGLPYLANMYGRVLMVATGSGICVFLSFLLQRCSAEVCVVWVAKGIEENFGKEMMALMERGSPEKKVIVHDTAVMGRPEMSNMSVKAAREWGAEVVIVTSNPKGSRDVVNACNSAGIPAFGPIWDS